MICWKFRAFPPSHLG